MNKKRFHIVFIALMLFISLPASKLSASITSKHFTVVIDAGHGGNDPGALGKRGKEKDINLKVALKLGQYIQNNCSDVKVIYTRKRDVFIPLHKRAEIANNAKADLFISIHTNSLAKRSTRISGAETYTLGLHRTKENLEVAKKENAVILIEENYKQQYAGFNPNSSESYIIFEFMQDKNLSQSVSFASEIQKEFKNCHRVNRGVHQAGFLVLRATSMPSVLVELGYISNPNEESYLLSENGTTTLAKAIYKAFLTYKQQNDASKSVTLTGIQSTSTNKRTGTIQTVNKQQPKQEINATKKASNPGTNKQYKDTEEKEHKLIFKIQIFALQKKLPANSLQFKGLKPISYFKENGVYKYTYGADTDYNKIKRLKKSQTDKKFKDAFIIAFKDGKRININKAIKEYQRNK